MALKAECALRTAHKSRDEMDRESTQTRVTLDCGSGTEALG